MSEPPDLFTDDYDMPIDDDYGDSLDLYFEVNQPAPCTILGVVPQIETEDA